jgi:hypothetical protein
MANDNEVLGNNITVSDKTQTDAVESLDIAQLRKFANIMKIPAKRDWSKEDYIAAIKAKQDSQALATFVFDPSTAPAPGKARLIIHRDPSPNHKNSPIHVGVNGYLISIPRGIEVDIPIPHVEALQNAKTVEINQMSSSNRENPSGTYKDEERTSYPFQVLAVTPGEFFNPHDNRGASYAASKRFFDKFGAWPTEGELKEVTKADINRQL